MKKKWTEQELYDLAADVHYVSQIIHLIDSVDGGKTEFDWEHYMDRLENAMEYISPKYVKDYEDGLEEEFYEAMNDPEINALVEESMIDPRAQEFIDDLGKIKRGEMTIQELKDKIRTQREQKTSDNSVEEMIGLNGMDEELAKQFLEELKATGGDLAEWIDRKGQENESFTGLELDPEKLKRMATIQTLCKSIKKLDKYVDYRVLPLRQGNRHGGIQLQICSVNVWTDKRILDALSQLFKLADAVTISAAGLIKDDDDEYEEEQEQSKGIVLTFDVMDMWKMYGKAPFWF